MFRKIGDGLRRFMAGRYGSDRLNQCLLGAAFVLLLISLAMILVIRRFGTRRV